MTNFSVRRRLAATLAALVAATGTTVASAAPAASVPARINFAEPVDDEGGTDALRKQLDEATRGFVEAQEALARSKKRQKQLNTLLTRIDTDLAARQESIGEIVDEAYRTGRLGPVTAILNAGSSGGFLDRAATLEVVAAREDRAVRELRETRTAQQQAKAAIDTEIRNQQKQVTLMDRRKEQAERALRSARLGGDAAGAPGGGGGGGGGGVAQAARRNSDGSLPRESCSRDDPTTGGCITPRTLHALQQAKKAGFTRFVSCFRSGGSGEHPKGRACDYAAQRNGFGGVATGGDRDYGNRLANYFVRNASRLGVLYVIWFERIWLPSSGWRTYTRGQGDPSSDHTNHVHLSLR